MVVVVSHVALGVGLIRTGVICAAVGSAEPEVIAAGSLVIVAELGAGTGNAGVVELLVYDVPALKLIDVLVASIEDESRDNICVAPLLASMFSKTRTTVFTPSSAVIVVVHTLDSPLEEFRLVEVEALAGGVLVIVAGIHVSAPRGQIGRLVAPLKPST